MSENNFDSKSLGLRAQKKLLGKMASKKIAKVFIDDTSGKVLDDVYRAVKDYSGSKKTAEKIMKDIIKIVIKIGILYRNDQYSQAELELASKFKQKFRMLVLTVISFHEVSFTYDKQFLISSLTDCQNMLKELISRHLTDKSKGRVDNVFQFFANPEFLDSVFMEKSPYSRMLGNMVEDLNRLVDEGTL